jgi:alpha-N-arabinofuranosidase
MIAVRCVVQLDETVADVPRRLFGTFVEHLGRGVYQGIHEPGHPTADEHGFRQDVLALVRELGVTAVRYPGGNFVSGYRWEDGVGPADRRPVRLDGAWHSLETNQVGLHEFAGWAKAAGLELMEAINLGTRGVAEAADLLEYANHPGGTELSERRRSNGADQPFGIRLWCLGNEMDGPWQIGHKTADEYGRLAAETARFLRFIDPRVELVAAGSSNPEMPTFGSWERTVLRHTAGLVDHISVHAYYEETGGDVDSFLASGVGLDSYLDAVAAIVDEVGVEQGLSHTVGISVDEWNVWYQTRWNEQDKDAVLTGDWPEHPRLLEDEYNVTDAVVVGSLLIALLRHADRVTMANLAQLVNVIAPIRCEPGGPAWRQTTFFPFALTATEARGRVVRPRIETPLLPTAKYGAVPMVDAVSTVDADGSTSFFIVNRSSQETAELTLDLVGSDLEILSAQTLTIPDGGDRFTVNGSDEQPVAPVALQPVACVTGSNGSAGTRLTAVLPALSWTVFTFAPSPTDGIHA